MRAAVILRMSANFARNPRPERAAVKPLTRGSRKHGALASIASGAVITVIAVACSETPAATEEWTARPGALDLLAPQDAGDAADARSPGDAGDAARVGDGDADDAAVDEPPLPLCTLTGPPAATPGDTLVFSEEFDGTAVDPLNWNVQSGYRGHGGIANTASPANAVVKDGTLQITTERDPANTQYPYKSGHIDSLGKFARTYGKIEFRARFPFAAGVWFALWGRPWSQPFPEIDIEIINRPAKTNPELYFVNHWASEPLPANDRRSFAMLNLPDLSEFHVYTVLWKPDLLEWQFDGVTKMQAKPQGIPNLPVYWIINGWVGSWVGNPTDATPFPNTFEVDYVRVYPIAGVIADPLLKIVNQRTKYKRTDAIQIAAANFDEACVHVEMYDGNTPTRTTSTRPYQFRLSTLGTGMHHLTFVATDGVRSTTSTIDVQID